MAMGKMTRKYKASAPRTGRPGRVVKEYVKKAINRRIDKEWILYNSGVVNTNTITTTYGQIGDSFSNIPQGTATGNRSGDMVMLEGVWLSARLRTTNATVGDCVTLSILRRPANQGTSIVPGDYYANDTAGFAPVSQAQDDKGVKLVWQRTYKINPNTAGPSVYINRYIKFRNPIKITYLRGVSTGTDASVVDNVVSFFGACFAGAATSIDYAIQGKFYNI